MSCDLPRALSAGETEVASFRIVFRRFIDADGTETAPLPASFGDPQRLIAVYRAMVMTRSFDEHAIALQRTGKLGTYASSLGQEAVAVGTAAAMSADDIFLPSFREHGALLWRGVGLSDLFLYWAGDERGNASPTHPGDFPVCIPVASQFPHAAGVALALQLEGKGRAAVCMGGDGSTSKGDFYEAINIAAVWKLPVVFVISNNRWAISVPAGAQTAAETLAQKAIAAGMPGEQVDGNDVVAIADAVERALLQARASSGPTLVEAVTYRLSDHTTADDARRYRNDAEVSRHWSEEPVKRLKTYLVDRKLWSAAQEEELLQACARQVEDAAKACLATPAEPPEAMFDHLFAALPEPLRWERDLLIARQRGHG